VSTGEEKGGKQGACPICPQGESARLAVKPQDVVPGETESADRCLLADAGVRSMPIVAMKPESEIALSLIGVVVCCGVSPLSQRGLDEALGLSIGLWGVGPRPDRLYVEAFAGTKECFRAIA
jgi:hypothetical protein